MGKICTLDLAQHLISDRLWAPLPYTQHIYIERESSTKFIFHILFSCVFITLQYTVFYVEEKIKIYS